MRVLFVRQCVCVASVYVSASVLLMYTSVRLCCFSIPQYATLCCFVRIFVSVLHCVVCICICDMMFVYVSVVFWTVTKTTQWFEFILNIF
jgi:hypothetical protein